MTKKDAALQVLSVARQLIRTSADTETSVWVQQLLWIAEGLDPRIVRHFAYVEVVTAQESRTAKLRRLIEHPNTPVAEREAAVVALDRLRRAEVNRGTKPE